MAYRFQISTSDGNACFQALDVQMLYDLTILVSLLYIMNFKNIWIRFKIIFLKLGQNELYLRCQKD